MYDKDDSDMARNLSNDMNRVFGDMNRVMGAVNDCANVMLNGSACIEHTRVAQLRGPYDPVVYEQLATRNAQRLKAAQEALGERWVMAKTRCA